MIFERIQSLTTEIGHNTAFSVRLCGWRSVGPLLSNRVYSFEIFSPTRVYNADWHVYMPYVHRNVPAMHNGYKKPHEWIRVGEVVCEKGVPPAAHPVIADVFAAIVLEFEEIREQWEIDWRRYEDMKGRQKRAARDLYEAEEAYKMISTKVADAMSKVI